MYNFSAKTRTICEETLRSSSRFIYWIYWILSRAHSYRISERSVRNCEPVSGDLRDVAIDLALGHISDVETTVRPGEHVTRSWTRTRDPDDDSLARHARSVPRYSGFRSLLVLPRQSAGNKTAAVQLSGNGRGRMEEARSTRHDAKKIVAARQSQPSFNVKIYGAVRQRTVNSRSSSGVSQPLPSPFRPPAPPMMVKETIVSAYVTYGGARGGGRGRDYKRGREDGRRTPIGPPSENGGGPKVQRRCVHSWGPDVITYDNVH